MRPSTSLSCPNCTRVLGEDAWMKDGRSGSCRVCHSSFDFIPFAALGASAEQVPDLGSLTVLQDEACCFFHKENKAEQVCEACGRYLCSVCVIDFGGRRLCSSCIEKEQLQGTEKVVNERLLWDSLALALAVLPIVIFPLFFFPSAPHPPLSAWPWSVSTSPAAS